MRRAFAGVASRGTSRISQRISPHQLRNYRASPACLATPLPITATGPPPSAPKPEASSYGERIDRKRKQAALLQKAKEIRAAQKPSSSKKDSPLRKRFWKDVHVKEVADGYHIFLDERPVRTPSKNILTIPRSKPHLAYSIAIEWDLLVEAQQALKNHNIPMTSIASRAQDLIEAERAGRGKIREDIIKVMMRYLDTDTVLCWAPEPADDDVGAVGGHHQTLDMERQVESRRQGESLRQIQMRVAKEIIAFLNTSIWPGVEIKPVLDENSILPNQQSDVTRSIISGWMAGLPAYELAALERAVLASKSLLIGARLLVEWSEEFRDVQTTTTTKPSSPSDSHRRRFGIEEAAEASTIEVRWQTGMWGEVEDTHDVDKEDVRRQLGSAVLVVSGGK